MSAYPGGPQRKPEPASQQDAVVVPLRTHGGVLSFLSTITVFGTTVDISLSELSLEAFYPADEATAVVLRRTSAQQPTS